MRPLSELAAGAEGPPFDTLVFDLDDTFLDGQILNADAYLALERLQAAGLGLVACTGRPAGFAEVVMRQWPLSGAVAENGAIFFLRREDGGLTAHDPVSSDVRRERRRVLQEHAATILTEFPAFARSDDDWARRSDVALDHGEHRSVPPEQLARAVARVEELGANCFCSSIHLHLTFERTDKAEGYVALEAARGRKRSEALARAVYVGDSENDAPAFAAIPLSVGVGNVRARADRLSAKPAFVTSAERSAGFVELAEHLLALRRVGRGA